MQIFQPTVLKNFPQDESKVAQRWAKYQEYVAKIASFEGKDIFVTEFLYAKIQSILESHHGHKEIVDEYVNILPFVFLNYDEIIIDKRNSRKIISIFDNEHRRTKLFGFTICNER